MLWARSRHRALTITACPHSPQQTVCLKYAGYFESGPPSIRFERSRCPTLSNTSRETIGGTAMIEPQHLNSP